MDESACLQRRGVRQALATKQQKGVRRQNGLVQVDLAKVSGV